MSFPLLVGLAGFPLLALAALPFPSGRSLALGIIYRVGQLALIALVILLALFLFVPETAPVATHFHPVCLQLHDDIPGYALAEQCVGRWLLLSSLVVAVGLPQLMLIKKLIGEFGGGSGPTANDANWTLPKEIEHPKHRPLLVKDIVRIT